MMEKQFASSRTLPTSYEGGREYCIEPRRFPDGRADWKAEYDRADEINRALRRDGGAAQHALTQLMVDFAHKWQVMRAEKRWSEADALRRQVGAAGITLANNPAGQAVWAIEGTMIGGVVDALPWGQ